MDTDRRARFLLWLLPLLLVLSCKGSVPSALIQLDGAKEVKKYSLSGMDVIEYKLGVKYPAKKVIDDVSKRLAEKGWKPLPYLFLYPKYNSSNIEGWSVFPDPPKTPARMIYEWSGNWQDSNRTVVIYTFRYADPYEKYTRSVFSLKPGNSELLVTGITMSEEVAKGRQIQPHR
jgi:hypothetical protein